MTGYKCPVTAGKWSFVSGRYDGSSMYMNVDGYVCQFKHFTPRQQPGALGRSPIWNEQLLASYSIGEQMLAQWRTITTDDDDAVPPPEACPHHVPDAPLSELAYHIYFARHLPLASLTRAVRTRFEAREYPKTLVRLYSWTPDECVPELYEDEHFFESRHREFADMAVSDWCLGKDENVQQARRRFIEKHRRALEGRRASSELHRWIDLVF
ncbi:hypothetical protein PPROV_000495400 [Pycnococcus provasolii]|uniref:BEACH domain-containing protein n=1 Tax=Pycnococcus provasolii TaxID=41880 RepID=A0A830HMF8_9CHLO|nr:hypothetical protein PPROV_000495400 [Pycnococcus provasolii]